MPDKILARQVGYGPGPTPLQLNLIVRWRIAGQLANEAETPFPIAIATGPPPVPRSEVAIIADLRQAVADHVTTLTGVQFTAADVRGFKNVQRVTVSVTAVDLTKDVTLPVTMPSTSYMVVPTLMGNLATTVWITNKLTTGFTLNLSVGVVGDIDCLVVED